MDDKNVKGATVQIHDRVLVRNVNIRGKQKLADLYEENIYHVLDQPDKNIAVFKVQREDKKGSIRTLHRNLLLPVNYLPVKKLTTETPSKKHHKIVTRLEKNVSVCFSNSFSSSSSESDSEASDEYLLPEFVYIPKIIPLETQPDQVGQSDQEETSIVKDTNEKVVGNELDNVSVFESDASSEHTNEVVKDDYNAELHLESP